MNCYYGKILNRRQSFYPVFIILIIQTLNAFAKFKSGLNYKETLCLLMFSVSSVETALSTGCVEMGAGVGVTVVTQSSKRL